MTIPIDAGAQVGFIANSLNCRAIKNCDSTSLDMGGGYAGCHPITIANLPASAGITQPYAGQFMVMNLVAAVERWFRQRNPSARIAQNGRRSGSRLSRTPRDPLVRNSRKRLRLMQCALIS